MNGQLHPVPLELLRYADGEAGIVERWRVRRHLRNCWSCQADIVAMQSAMHEFAASRDRWAPPEPDWPDLTKRMREQRPPEPLPLLTGRMRPFALAAASAAVLAGAALLLQPRAEQRPPVVAKAAAAASAVRTPPPPTPSPAVSRNTAAERDPNVEVRALAALHEAGADLGEPIELVYDGEWKIVATAIAPPRLEEIRSALGGLPVKIVADEPVAARTAPASAPSGQTQRQGRSRLEAALGGRAAFENLTNAIFEENDALLARGFALRNLERRFPDPGAISGAAERRLLERIREDHRRAYVAHARRLITLTEPVRIAIGAGDPGVPAQTVPAQTAPAADAALQLDRVLNRILGADSAAVPTDGPTDSVELQAALAAVAHGVR